jgi:hypothetical protein
MNVFMYTTMVGALDSWSVIESNNASVGFQPNHSVEIGIYPTPTPVQPNPPEAQVALDQNSEMSS